MLKSVALFFINFYQKWIRIFMGRQVCVFFPSCSEYTKEAVLKYGAIRGSWLGFKRILRCHPWQKNHIDPLK